MAGAANNQLRGDSDGVLLHKRGILYAPDYVINAGGLMNVSLELEGYSEARARTLIRSIYYNLKRIFQISEDQKIMTHEAADHLAEERIINVSRIKRGNFLSKSKIRRRLISPEKANDRDIEFPLSTTIKKVSTTIKKAG